MLWGIEGSIFPQPMCRRGNKTDGSGYLIFYDCFLENVCATFKAAIGFVIIVYLTATNVMFCPRLSE